MSLDAGGLAQMTFNPHNAFGNGLGVPGSGFASRGKGSNIKRLSVAPPTKISTIDEMQQTDPAPTPRTSRSHLLAGLRTAPKTATFPSAATSSHYQQNVGLNGYPINANNLYARAVPQTAVGGSFPRSQHDRYHVPGNNQMYSHPGQVLAPPALQVAPEQDPEYYAELLATNQQLAQQQILLQHQLQQQLSAAAQQLNSMDMNRAMAQQYLQSPLTQRSGFYQQQLQSGLQPVVQAVAGRPGLYCVYNPMTGQQTLMMDNAGTQQTTSPPPVSNHELRSSPPPPTPTFRAQVSPPPETAPSNNFRTDSPPKPTSPPSMLVSPLPPPSANAFRRGHHKALSLASESLSAASDGPKTGVPKTSVFPQTPMTGTFGPGQARAGDHPVRQPRGPPALEELIARPTSKHEGSKNFATRQRRRAVSNLVRAGIERRGASRGSGSMDSFGSMTPASEGDMTFSVPSDGESDSIKSGSGSLSGKPSLGSLRAVASGAIGSEMKERSRERNSTGTPPAGLSNATSVSSEEGFGLGGKMVEAKLKEKSKAEGERRQAPLLVLTSAEKRKSSLF
ncbi:MAG: hypothetical protein L6R37_003066 [Teloschistes peruensis]|nr:MAG: hypothetical protein L6R37_003066 [Teloschistes peruensis]